MGEPHGAAWGWAARPKGGAAGGPQSTGTPLGPLLDLTWLAGMGAVGQREGNADILGPVVWELGWKGEK